MKSSVLRVFVGFVLLSLVLALIGCGGIPNNGNSSNSTPSNVPPGNTGGPGPGSVPSNPEFLYLSTSLNPQIFGFAIDPNNGKLSLVPGAPFTDDTTTPRVCSIFCSFIPFKLLGDPAGRYLYAVSSTGRLTQFKLDRSGKPTINASVTDMGKALYIRAEILLIFSTSSTCLPSGQIRR